MLDLGDLAAIDEAQKVVLSVSGIKGAVWQSLEASGDASQPPFVRC